VPSDHDALIDANQAFYDAHEARDLNAMSHLWHDGDRVVCVHPGWPILRGREAVLASWQRIFDGPGRNQFILTNVRADGIGDAGWVSLEENLIDGAETHTIAATNIFVRQQGRWRLLSHHGSPIVLT